MAQGARHGNQSGEEKEDGQMIIAIDVDGVVLDLRSAFLKRYNRDYDDHLTLDDLMEWDIAKAVKPECGIKAYHYLEIPDVYREALPIADANYALAELRKDGHRLVFATTCAPGTEGVKLEILTQYGFLSNRKDYIEVADKSLIRADVLIDDGIHNLEYFGGERIIFDQSWNRHQSIGGSWRARNWKDALEIVRAINKSVSFVV